MYRLLRMFGLLFAVWAVLRAWLDFSRTVLQGWDFRFQKVGEVWANFDKDSLLQFQPMIERHIGEWVWDPFIFTVLQTDMAALLALLSIGLLLVTNRENKRRRPRMRFT